MSADNRILMGPSGGSGGSPPYAKKGTFKEIYHYFLQMKDSELPKAVEARQGHLIDELGVLYEHGRLAFGGPGGHLSRFDLKSGEYITKVFGTYSRFVVSFGIETSAGRKKEWGGLGGKGRLNYEYTAPSGYIISGLFGNSGIYVDAVGVILIADPSK